MLISSNMKQVVIIGSGFAGLSAACFLAKSGFEVTVLEKNEQAGGRARVFQNLGFTFDMGPSWYWMPDIFERFFQQFGSSVAEHYQLTRLDPSYRVYFGPSDYYDVPANWEQLASDFEQWEPGAARKLAMFLAEAEIKYQQGIGNFVFKPGRSVLEFCNWTTLKGALQLDLFSNFKQHVGQYFRHPRILKILEFPVLFLGATPEKTPALYSLMNFADIKLGTWYPKMGMGQIVKGMQSIATSLGVRFHFEEEVRTIDVEPGGKAHQVVTDKGIYEADVVVANADYAFVDQTLLEPHFRSYNSAYWESRVMAPSSLLYYVGLEGKVENLVHHNLFFDEDFALHAKEIYEKPRWPSKPLFYLSVPSKTDESVAPKGCENLFFLIPTAPGLMESDEIAEAYFQLLASKTKSLTGNDIASKIMVKIPYGPRNFVADYHAHKGNAYGLANTLRQTSMLKPSLKSKKVKNLFFTGQLTVPGPGVPPALISGEVVAKEIIKEFQS